MTQPLALADLTVLDLSHALAGPFATTMLADYGADVIKIETPGSGDMSREWGPPFYGEESAYFVGLNRNKRSVTLDLKRPEGKQVFFDLLAKADIVIENMRVGTATKLGLGYEALKARRPEIIYCSISGFGQDGPYRERTALDLVVQAESGMISVTGPAGGPGVRCGMSIADTAAGMFAAFSILAAVNARRTTGNGQFIDVSMLEGQLSLLQTVIGTYLGDGIIPQPWGTGYAVLLPYQTFRTKTRELALGVGSDKLWRSFCPLIGLDELTDDPRFVTNAARVANRPALIAALQARFETKTYEEWEAILLPKGIPVGPVNTIDQVVKHPQVIARQSLVPIEHPVAGTVKVVGPPARLSDTPGSIRRPAPLLGQHTEEVLRQHLGLKDAELERLRKSGAFGE
jgi:crotonobetainyl-CoA:carnitine CoA-transferase CaiB-like acyl-CoA transferase